MKPRRAEFGSLKLMLLSMTGIMIFIAQCEHACSRQTWKTRGKKGGGEILCDLRFKAVICAHA